MVYNVHYCLDKIFISTSTSNSCELCGTTKKKDCCKDEVKTVKTDVAQKADVSFLSNAPIAAILPDVFYAEFLKSAVERNQFSVQVNAPPDKAKLPLFISYCNFRI